MKKLKQAKKQFADGQSPGSKYPMNKVKNDKRLKSTSEMSLWRAEQDGNLGPVKRPRSKYDI